MLNDVRINAFLKELIRHRFLISLTNNDKMLAEFIGREFFRHQKIKFLSK